MKKIIFLFVSTLFTVSIFAKIIVVRWDGGLFGYNYVDETHDGTNHELQCHNPGYSRCNWSVIPPLSDGRTLSESRYDQLIEYADDRISNHNDHTGILVTTDDLVMTWLYNAHSGKTTIHIYDIVEATSLGII